MADIFDLTTQRELLARLASIRPDAKRQWGKMTVAQMLAHCCLPIELMLGKADGSQTFIQKCIAMLFSGFAASEKPFIKNLPMPEFFIVATEKNFDFEKARLTQLMLQMFATNAADVEGRRHKLLGVLTAREWSNLMYRHLDHHFRQFGA